MEDKSDAELIALARGGNKDAFGALVGHYQMIAQRTATNMVSDQDLARDLTQEAMLQAYLSLDQLRDVARFKSWLCGIVLNVSRNYIRDHRIVFFSLETLAGGLLFDAIPYSGIGTDPQAAAEERELHRLVLNAVQALAPEDREAIRLFYYDELTLREIAANLGTTVGAVKVRLHRARKQLRDDLLLSYFENIRPGQGRKKMMRATVVDVVKQERTDDQGLIHARYVVVLQDEVGQRALPIWVGPFEGQSIAMGLGEFSAARPMTFNLIVNLLQAADIRVEAVRIEALKEDTFYAIVKIRSGERVHEVDARPSDALALAVRTGSPIYIAEDVMERGGTIIQQAAKVRQRKGVEGILREIEEMQRAAQTQLMHPRTAEEITKARAELIASVFATGE